MEHIANLENISVEKDPKRLFKDPNTVDLHYGKDVEDAFKLGEPGKDVFTSEIVQDFDWSTTDITYKWNSLGLRGPEPNYNANTRILFAGGSLSLGVGVPLEKTFPYVLSEKLNASYINLSDADTITDLIDPLKKFKDFDPTVVVINDTRFIQQYGWALIDIYKVRNIEGSNLYKTIFADCDRTFLMMFECYLKMLFPNALLVLATCDRRSFKRKFPDLEHFVKVPFFRNEVVDLARDNAHPGPLSHAAFAEKIYQSIDKKIIR